MTYMINTVGPRGQTKLDKIYMTYEIFARALRQTVERINRTDRNVHGQHYRQDYYRHDQQDRQD
jgi:hypothetical protein